MSSKTQRNEILKAAWIGDAVLTLYVRRRILREDGHTDGNKAQRMTSNQFLSAVGQPDEVEAEIGRIFERDGLEAAWMWIESRLMPTFHLQEAKRDRKAGKEPR